MNTIKHLFTALLLLCATVAKAHDFEAGGIYYSISSSTNKTVEVTYRGDYYNSYNNEYTGSVVIQESVTYNGSTYSVTSIGNQAFENCTELTSIEIPNSITSIKRYAFEGCTGLTSITIPNSVTSIGERAFSWCSGITSITIPNSVTFIGDGAFLGTAWYENQPDGVVYAGKVLYEYNGAMPENTSIVINDGTLGIAGGAFSGCTGLTSIIIPNSVTSIGLQAFRDCTGLMSIIVATGNANYDSRDNCNAIIETATNTLVAGCKNTLIPNSITSIERYAFCYCTGLTSITIPNSVTSIGGNAFSGCSGLTSIVIGSSVTSIGDYAFDGCTGLTSITIPNSVTSIGGNAFSGCSGLTSIVIGSSVTSIGKNAFDGCTGLKKVIWLTNTPPSRYKNVGATYNYVANNEYSGLSNVKVYSYLSSIFEVDGVKYVPVSPAERTCDAIDCAYNDTTSVDIVIGKTVSYKGISMNVKEIMPYALYANKKIKSVKFENEGNIGNYAFSGCTALQTADISNEGNIGGYAFSGCTALQSADISNEGSIGGYAFSGCNNLAEAILGDSVTSIGTEGFSNCTTLGNIVIPDAVTSIGNEAFSGCSALKSTEIGAGVTTINEATFSGCSAMTSITIGGSVKTIGKNAFYGCSALAEISIPQSVTKIADYVFDNCSSLTDVIIEDNSTVLSLGSNGSSPLFADCPLDSMYIGRKISYSKSSSYGHSPFYRNTSLRTVVITDTETEIYDNEFYGCSNLKNVSIGNGVNKIGKWAFSGCSSLDYFAFGDNVQSIGEEAFSDCNNVTRILTSAMTPPVCGNQALDDINKWNCSLYVPSEAKSAYQLAEQWREFFFIEDLPLGINDVVDDENYNGFSGVYYDLNGRAVEKPANGIYIINGKKVLVK